MVITFVTCSYVLMYIRLVTSCSVLIPIFCQSGNKSKMTAHIGFVYCNMAVTTDGNISNQVTVVRITMHTGFVNLYMEVLILMSLILRNYSVNRIYKFVYSTCINPLQISRTSWKREFFIPRPHSVWYINSNPNH